MVVMVERALNRLTDLLRLGLSDDVGGLVALSVTLEVVQPGPAVEEVLGRVEARLRVVEAVCVQMQMGMGRGRGVGVVGFLFAFFSLNQRRGGERTNVAKQAPPMPTQTAHSSMNGSERKPDIYGDSETAGVYPADRVRRVLLFGFSSLRSDKTIGTGPFSLHMGGSLPVLRKECCSTGGCSKGHGSKVGRREGGIASRVVVESLDSETLAYWVLGIHRRAH